MWRGYRPLVVSLGASSNCQALCWVAHQCIGLMQVRLQPGRPAALRCNQDCPGGCLQQFEQPTLQHACICICLAICADVAARMPDHGRKLQLHKLQQWAFSTRLRLQRSVPSCNALRSLWIVQEPGLAQHAAE